MPIRQLAEADIPQVAGLYWNYLCCRKGPAPTQLHPFFRELYFANPWVDSASPSFVYENVDGKVVGFMGITARKMSFGGKPIRAIYGGNFVVHPEARSGVATPRLVEAFIGESHDLVLADSANDVARHVLERRGFQTIAAMNIHWVRPLRPARYAVHALSRTMRPALSTVFQFAATPGCVLADAMVARTVVPFRPIPSRLLGSPLDVETLAHCMVEFRQGYSLWPEYDVRSLNWLIGFMDRRQKRGELRRLVLRDEHGAIVGWYIYYVKRGAIGQVVQVCGNPKLFREVLRHLFQDAREQGLIALHGVADYRRMPDFSDEGCIFTCLGGWALAHSRDRELLAVLDRGNGFLSRLDGEWCLDPGE